MPTEFRYSFTDLFAAPKSALLPKNIGIATIFLLCAYTCLVVASYVAVLLDGEQLAFAVPVYGVFPPILKAHNSIGAMFVWYIGFGCATLFLFQGMLGIALSTVEELRGNHFFSFGAIIKQSFIRLPQLLGTLVGIGLLILLCVALLMLLGLLAHIPVIGDWLWTLFLALPNFLIAMGLVGMVYLIGGAAISFLPTIIAADRRREVFGPIVEVFSVVMRQPFRWLSCSVFTVLFAKLGGFIYAFVTVKALGLLVDTSAITGGRQIPELVEGAMSHLPVHGVIADFFFSLYPGSDLVIHLDKLFGRPSTDVISYFCAFMLGILFATIPAFMLSVISVTLTRGYMLIAYAKDKRRVTEESSIFAKEQTT